MCLDNVLIVSKSFQEQLEHVDKVLKRLNEAGLRLKPSKCRFAQERVESQNDRKVQAVKDFPTPKCW